MTGITVLGRYRIVARLAKGGMGIVYLARAEGAAGFAKPVVVKRVLPDLTGDAKMARLFVREAKILANLQHPNIVSVIDFGEEDGAYIMVLDYVRAYHLGLWAGFRSEQHKEGRGDLLPIEGVVHIMTKVLDALEYAHGLTGPDGAPLEIVHADISPANILVDQDGQVKLLDFGIARMRGEATQTTDSKSIRGKFSYLPIEALDGSPPTIATDVYACGVTLYELLAGENPYTGTDETRTLAKVISHDPTPISQVRPGVSPELEAIVHRAMSKDRDKRFASAKDFARELRKVQKLPEDEATRALAVVAKGDFAAMPAREGTSLADLDAAWRNPPPALGGAQSSPKLRVSSPDLAQQAALAATIGEAPTQLHELASGAAEARTVAATSSQNRRGFLIGVGIGAVLLVGALVALVVILLRRSDDQTKLVVIERSSNSSETAGAGSVVASSASIVTPASSSAAAADDSARPTASTAGTAGKGPKPPAGGDPLSAAFAKNQPEIEACFRDKAAPGSSPEVSVRFSIDKEGVVQRAEVIPSDLTSTPLGQCIVGVAKRTRFPAQSAPATFRIPLRAKKSG